MIVYVNANSEIKAVGSSSDASLTALTINDDTNPFKDWRTAKICSYKVEVDFEKVKNYYDKGLWDKNRVHNAVGKWITAEEYEEITGEPFEE